MNRQDKIRALAGLDGLLAELKAGDETATTEARQLLHRVIDDSEGAKLGAMLLPLKILFERDLKE